MALGRLSRVTILSRVGSRNVNTRYSQCRVIQEDGGVTRLSFRRYAEFDQESTGATQTGILAPGSEHRLDSVSRTIYGDPRFFWAVAWFNRWVSLNPLRFESQVKLAFPTKFFLNQRVATDMEKLV